MINNIICYSVTAVTLVGTFANAFQKRWSFLVWMATNAFWIAYNIKINQIPQAIIYAANLVTSVIGYYKWGKIKENNNEKNH